MNSRLAVFQGMLAFCALWASERDAQWVQARNLPGGRIRDDASLDSGFFLAIGGLVFRSDDEGATWAPLPSPGKEVYSIEAFDGTLLAGTPAGVYQSPPKDVSWKPFERPGLPAVPALSMWTYLGYLYIGSVGAVYKSIDQGNTWAETKSGLPPDARITCFAGIVKIAVAGSENRGVFITESSDWISAPDSEGANRGIRDLDVFGNKVYAVTVHGVLESAHLGADWVPSSMTLPDMTCLLGDGGNLFAGTNQGIRYSLDKGKSWIPFNEGFPEKAAIRSLVASGGSLFASTDGGVWRIASPTAGSLSLPSRAHAPPPHLPGRRASRIEIIRPDANPVYLEWADLLGRRIRPITPSHSGP